MHVLDYIAIDTPEIMIIQWAYGVTCWEIFVGGKVPYPGVHLTDLPRLLANGERLEKPANDACDDEMYVSLIPCIYT